MEKALQISKIGQKRAGLEQEIYELDDLLDHLRKTGTIKIKVSQGIVQEVEGLPEGYQYEIVECDKYGKPLPKIPPHPGCAICGGAIIGDNWNESQGVVIHNECPHPEE